MGKKVSAQTNDAILTRYMGGGSASEIAKEYDVSAAHVHALVSVFNMVRGGNDEELFEKASLASKRYSLPVIRYCYSKCGRSMPQKIEDVIRNKYKDDNSRPAEVEETTTDEVAPIWAVKLILQQDEIIRILNAVLDKVVPNIISQVTNSNTKCFEYLVDNMRKETDALMLPIGDCRVLLEYIKKNTRKLSQGGNT